MMIISKTPLRVSFVGGGSDVTSFSSLHGGAVVSTTIDKYVYVIVTERFDDNIRVSYSSTEIVEHLDDLEHELAREVLRVAGLRRRTEVVTISDVPSHGTGLGSSSAVTVGLLNALFAYQGILKPAADLAEEAARIEIDVLGKPIGKQDHYACAFGGLQYLQFGPGPSVRRHPLVLTAEQRGAMSKNLLMFFTGTPSNAQVLTKLEEAAANPRVIGDLKTLRDEATRLFEELGRGWDANVLGEYLERNWQMKRRLPEVTNPEIDALYEKARGAGATGGKLLGSGGGGFLLFWVPQERQAAVRGALLDLRELPFGLETDGSRIIHVGS